MAKTIARTVYNRCKAVHLFVEEAGQTQSAQSEGSLLTAGNYFESGKSECNNSGYKLTGLTWWP